MLKKETFEIKKQEDPILKAKELLGGNEEFIKIELVGEKKGILGFGSSQTYEATINQSLVLLGKNFLEKLLFDLGLEVKMEFRTLDEGKHLVYNVETSDNALIIGKRGVGLDGLQNILKAFLNQFTKEKLIVNLDIGSYHQKRIRSLEITATKTAKDVIRTKQEIALSNLNSFERRVIHTKLSEWRDVETYSEGAGEERKLIVKFKENK